MKRVIDILIATCGLLACSPVLLSFMFLIWLQDRRSPLYIAKRVGLNRKPFRMVKLRSMVVRADKIGGTSTSGDDKRITAVGKMIRAYKLDEICQLWNVLTGDMSLVGPRPNTEADVALYTGEEMHLLDVRPGITDISSIVFSDEGAILQGSPDPDLKYNQVIRPYKSRLGLLYIQNSCLLLDIQLVFLTAVAIVSKSTALRGITVILRKFHADAILIDAAKRAKPLTPYPPPGSTHIAMSNTIATT